MTILGSNPRVRIDERHPSAAGICDMCGFVWNHDALRWQYEWRGNQLTNIRSLRCVECLDKPFENNRPIALPPDPEPVRDARPPQWLTEEGPPAPGPPIPVQQDIPDDE